MTYALGQTPKGANGISVGKRAKDDVILARASYDASQILADAVKRRRQGQRVAYMRRRLLKYGGDAPARFERERMKLLSQGWEPNQATYDAMRLVISNHYAKLGMMAIRSAMARAYGADKLVGLGDEGRDIGCGITAGVTGIVGLIGSIYGGAAGAGAAGTAGGVASQALDCGADARAAQERIAAANASAAQAQANAALQAAQAQERAAQERTKQVKTIIVAAGGLIVLGGVAYAIVKA